MVKTVFNRRTVLKFTHFENKAWSLFSVMGKEVIIGVLSVATLQNAEASSISERLDLAGDDSTMTRQTFLLDEVSVTGTRAPLASQRQARVVTVLGRDEIAAAAAQSVNDIIKYVASVDVRQKGPLGALTDVSVRGGSSEQIAVLLNGINIGDAQTGHNAFDFPVSIDDIDRIEVLQGPSARVYGTSSLLGAINIITRMPQKSSLSAHAEAGSYGYVEAGARGNLASGAWNNQLSASFLRSDGYLRASNGKLNSDYNVFKSFYQGNYAGNGATVKWHAGVSAKNYGSNTFYSVNFDDQFEHTLKTYSAIQAETSFGGFHLRPSAYWNYAYDRFELERGSEARVKFNYHRTNTFGLNLNGWFDWRLGRTAIGAEMRNEDIVSTTLGEPLDYTKHISGTNRDFASGLNRTNIQFVLEHNVLLGPLSLSAGIVTVKNTQADMDFKVYPSVDANVKIMEGLHAYASYNTSLRMPSFTELYYSVGGHQADKHLRPEELSAVEGGLKFRNDWIDGHMGVFHNHYKNLIDWIWDGSTDTDGSQIWKSVNFGTINALGVETSWAFDLSNLFRGQKVLKSLDLSYCFINQRRDETAGVISQYALEYLKNKFTANLQLTPLPKMLVSVGYRLQHRMGSYVDKAKQPHTYGTYGILDAKVSYDFGLCSVYASGNNLLARKYVDYGNVAQPRAWFTGGVAVKL